MVGRDGETARMMAATMDLLASLVDGRSADVDDVAARLDALAQETDDPVAASYQAAARSMLAAQQSLRRGGGGAAEVDALLARVSELVPDFEALSGGSAGEARRVLSVLADGSRPTDDQLRELVAAAEAEHGGFGAPMRHASVAAVAMWGGRETELARIDLAVEHAGEAVARTGPSHAERVQHLAGLAVALLRRYEIRLVTADLRAARDRLEEARAHASGPQHPQWSMVNQMLTDVRRMLGDADDAHRLAVDGLRGRVWQVLAQDEPGGLREAVRAVGEEAVEAARACLAANDAPSAVTALDLGRGLALFAATAPGTLAELLDAADAPDLARRWRAAVTRDDPGGPPASLRREVLAALTDADRGAALLDPPDAAEIGRALRTVDADALAYLVPGDGSMTGYMVVVSAAGRAGYVWLPDLALAHHPEIQDYLASGDVTAEDEFSGVLERVGVWAWDAAMRHLVESYLDGLPVAPSGRPRRVVLVPMGDLARVPWQAARNGQGRYAVEHIGISQVTSARMLCRTACLPPVPPGSGGLVLGDPDTGTEYDLLAARREAYAIREALYRGARYLGRRPNGTTVSGGGTVEEVAEWFSSADPADGTVAHLACHAFVDATGPVAAAYLTLAGGHRLHAEQLLALLARSPERAVGLVVLSGCRTGGSKFGHDEAYSLGTALLAGGVRSVVCTQWSIPDPPQPAFLFMIHHFHRTAGLPVWQAVHRAQLWALDEHREIPDAMPVPLHQSARSDALARVIVWASVFHWGR